MCIRDSIWTHATEWRKETLMDLGDRTFKTSIYHLNSNPAERALREVGRILQTYCHDQQRKWSDYIKATENFIILAYHESIRETPYTIMYGKPPPRAIEELINFPSNPCLLYTSRCV